MKFRLLNLTIFAVIMLMCCYHLAHGAETIYYTTNGNEVTESIPDWVNKESPYCIEEMKVYRTAYDELRVFIDSCWRYRVWACATNGQKGADVEPVPMNICLMRKQKYGK